MPYVGAMIVILIAVAACNAFLRASLNGLTFRMRSHGKPLHKLIHDILVMRKEILHSTGTKSYKDLSVATKNLSNEGC